jgi:hypothetical protein
MLAEVGLFASRRTKHAAMLDLIRKLRPVDCGVELIRVGGPGDGGYLVPDDLEGIEYCFSPGVGALSEFEIELADRGVRCFLADHSVDSPLAMRPEFVFDKKFLGASDRDKFFTLSTWKEMYLKDYAGDLLLQMDIEGSEYEVVLSTPDALLEQFRILVIEFHGLDRLFDSFAFGLLSSCFEKILNAFHVVHIHPNNTGETVKEKTIEIPEVMEFTFLNKKRVNQIAAQVAFPHRLDADSSPGEHLVLPKCWYS